MKQRSIVTLPLARLLPLRLGTALSLPMIFLSIVVLPSISLASAHSSLNQAGVVPESQKAGGWVEHLLPGIFSDIRFFNVALWQWVGLLFLALLATSAAFLITSLVVHAVRALVRRTKPTWDDALLRLLAGPLRLALAVLLFFASSFLLLLPASGQSAVGVLCKITAIFSVSWLIVRMIDVLASFAQQSLLEKQKLGASTLVPMGRRVTKVFVLIIASLSLLQNLGFSISGILAGVGVGGLAVALAAQKSLENLFGGLIVIADRPIKVGDYCRVGEHAGTVEDIGLRSCRIRTLDRTLVTIPNAEFSTARIENYAERDRMRFYTILQVGYDTSPDQMRYLLVEIRRLLFAHPKTLPDPCRVRFVNLGAHSLDIEAFAFVETRDWSEFLAIREDIFLRILDIVNDSGAYFAYPSQTLYLGRDAGRDVERSRRAEQAVEDWRQKGELPLPDFPAEMVQQINGTLEYPPAGSAARRPNGAA